MESQSILGEALKGIRKDVYLVTKVEATDPAQVRKAVEKSLAELQTDYLDATLIHGTPGLEQMTIERAMSIHDQLIKLRDERITRSVGLSAHGYFDSAHRLPLTGFCQMKFLAVFVTMSMLLVEIAWANWPQFRGVNSAGVATGPSPRLEFGPGRNELWHVPMASDRSSPCIDGDSIFGITHTSSSPKYLRDNLWNRWL